MTDTENSTDHWTQFKISCHYCRELFYYGELTKDHVVPTSKGGRNIVENVVPCCSACNNRKSNEMPTCECVFCARAVEMYFRQWEGIPVVKKPYEWVRPDDAH